MVALRVQKYQVVTQHCPPLHGMCQLVLVPSLVSVCAFHRGQDKVEPVLLDPSGVVVEVLDDKALVDQVGDYNVKIVELTNKQEDYFEKLADCDPSDAKAIKFYQGLIHNIGKRITGMKELRHGTKLNAIWEGKLMSELAKLEVL